MVKTLSISGSTYRKIEKFNRSPRERTTWVECAYWTVRTAIAPYLKKDQMVFAKRVPGAEGYLNKEKQAAATLRMRVREIQFQVEDRCQPKQY